MHLYTFPLDESILNYHALVQIHRWFQFYEHSNHNLNNQLTLLTENVHIKSTFDESIGHKEYRERVAKIAPDWQNAHHIHSMELKYLDYRNIALNLKIIYQNIGYLPNEELTNTALQYNTMMTFENAKQLPRFNKITIEQCTLDIPEHYQQFVASYSSHRINSLIYYFSSLYDSQLPNAEGFRDIFASEIDIQLPSAHCTNFDEFDQWFQEKPAQMLRSTHIVDSLHITPITQNTYQVTLEFSWTGASRLHPENNLATRTLHQWTVIDNPVEPFARIQTMSVQTLPCSIAAMV